VKTVEGLYRTLYSGFPASLLEKIDMRISIVDTVDTSHPNFKLYFLRRRE
jgi:hypothetical protein